MAYRVYFWKRAPFFRLLPPLMLGVLAQWHLCLSPFLLWSAVLISIVALLVFSFLRLFHKYRLAWVTGLATTLLVVCLGALLLSQQDIRNRRGWLGKRSAPNGAVVAILNEPLVEKANSFKSEARVVAALRNELGIPLTGKMLIYFQKSSNPSLRGLTYGSRIIFRKPPVLVTSSGNPGAFDFKRYCLFQGITHQVFLAADDFEILPGRETTFFQRLFYPVSGWVLDVLRRNIPGEKECGLAEALLIGYKNDLDKTLVQSYSNTGVVHVVAISGLHIGLVYWVLGLVLWPFRKNRVTRVFEPLVIIAGLWSFSLLAGGQPSVLRSALMFTCVVVGRSVSRKTSIYNSLAVSAFILLCYDPFWLWDIGFQLSYAAVVSIVVFMKPIYHLVYVKPRVLDMLWQLVAVTLAAQILTMPLSLYHFHQFPTGFLLTNIVAVPLSSLIVLGEILLCAVGFLPVIANFIGQILSWLIRQMNNYVAVNEQLPGALWEGMQINVIQVLLLYSVILCVSLWAIEKKRLALLPAAVLLLGFAVIRARSFVLAGRQRMMIVYNVPRRKAVDFIAGRRLVFTGDTALLVDKSSMAFHIRPARILFRVAPSGSLPLLSIGSPFVSFSGIKMLMVDTLWRFTTVGDRQKIDLLLLSYNARVRLRTLARDFEICKVIFDATVPAGRKSNWKADCDSLGIPWHDVADEGAFVWRIPARGN